MSVGPKNPPTFAMVTTNAIPAAAGAPVRKRVGIEKNGPYAEQCPIGTSASDKTANLGSERRSKQKNPALVISNGQDTCKGHSSVRSEWSMFSTMDAIVITLMEPWLYSMPRSQLLVII